jgi:D-alanine-D-alanine ligase
MATQALREIGIDVVQIDPGKNFIQDIKRESPDFVFLAVHGRGGEEGTLQDLLEILKIPYTGSSASSSSLCFDKHRLKSLLKRSEIDTPEWYSFTKSSFTQFSAAEIIPNVIKNISLPLVIKPAREGSAFGIKIVNREEDVLEEIVSAFAYSDRVMLEKYISGKEIAVTILGPSDDLRSLPAADINTSEPFYNFLAHYETGVARITKPTLSRKDLLTVFDFAEKAYQISGARDIARIDIIFDDSPKVLEINTIPGLTHTGPSAWSADQAGFGIDGLIERIARRAILEAKRSHFN